LKAQSRALVLEHEKSIRIVSEYLFTHGSIGRPDGAGLWASDIIKNILNPGRMLPPEDRPFTN
jgi:hypothetical protein